MKTARSFSDSPAVRKQVPLLVGLVGPSGSGKTYSALRLASGIQQVAGGDIYGIDTEADRMLHYADTFQFRHVPFKAPFGSLDYLAALTYCVEKGASVVIVDSMSHEHEGPGGMVDFQEQELDRMAGNDYGKRERVKMLAWVAPKAARRALINGLLQLHCNFIFCFRAKSISKPVRTGGKTEVVPQGFVPIAGDEFVYEQTINCLLLPKSGGVPTWQSENPGESLAMKLPEQFRTLFEAPQPLSEGIGRKLAEWARGGQAADEVLQAGREAASRGTEALGVWWKGLKAAAQKRLQAVKDAELKPAASRADEAANPAPAQAEQPERGDAYDSDLPKDGALFGTQDEPEAHKEKR